MSCCLIESWLLVALACEWIPSLVECEVKRVCESNIGGCLYNFQPKEHFRTGGSNFDPLNHLCIQSEYC